MSLIEGTKSDPKLDAAIKATQDRASEDPSLEEVGAIADLTILEDDNLYRVTRQLSKLAVLAVETGVYESRVYGVTYFFVGDVDDICDELVELHE